MITRFDHCVIAVRDLNAARTQFEGALGLSVYPGGQHLGLGTENAITRFGLDYLEFLSIRDQEEVLAAGIKRASLIDFLAMHQGGLLAYCLAVTDIDGLADRFRSTGLDALGPYEMERRRPDGMLLRWRLLVPGGTAWRRIWPFFIQWELSDDRRLQSEQPGTHAIGARRVASVTVLVEDLATAVDLYSRQLGLSLIYMHNLEGGRGTRASYQVGDVSIHLVGRMGVDPQVSALGDVGTGLYQIELAVTDLDAAGRYLALRNCALEPSPLNNEVLLIPPGCACGARVGLRQEPRRGKQRDDGR